ncbi:MAG: glycosyltransferase [bacterium]
MKNFINVVYSTQYDDKFNNKFDLTISNSIGVQHRIIRYINKGDFSLSELYNKALKEHKTKNSVFVFIHNDIIFKTKNWGKILLNKFNKFDYDIIGVAGSKLLNKNGIWWSDKKKLYGIVEHTDGVKDWKSTFSGKINGIEEVVTIDGLFMGVNPDFLQNEFNESYKGFHFYDVSFCLSNYLDGCYIGVTTDINILHKSIGEVNDNWEKNRQQLIEEYKEYLPVHVNYKLQDLQFPDIDTDKLNKYFVSIIIPTKNNFEILYKNIKSIVDKTKFKKYEIIIADTGSDVDTLKNYEKIKQLSDNLKIVEYDYYNFAKINNDVVKNHVNGDMLLFCNDDIELINDAITISLDHYNKTTNKDLVGTIGIRLHYPDNSIQHNGIVIGFNKENKFVVSHRNLNQIDRYPTHFREVIASTAAFLMISKQKFELAGMFNEDYIECFEDVELNLECIKLGYNNYIASDAVAYHYESITRKNNEKKIENELVDYKRLHKFVQQDKSKRKKSLD